MNSDKLKPSIRLSEADEQEALFRWAEYAKGQYPELALLFHIPNGGKRDKVTAARLKAQGVKAGLPDLFLPVSRAGWHGLFIELKVYGNKPTEKQKYWLTRLRFQQYYTTVCYGWEEAKDVIIEYLTESELISNKPTDERREE